MSETEKRLIEELEAEYREEFLKADKERTHRRYFNIGAIAGFIFVFISTSFEQEFYKVLPYPFLQKDGRGRLCIRKDFKPKRIKLSNGGSVEEYADLIDAYEKGIDVMNNETLSQYIKRIKAAERD